MPKDIDKILDGFFFSHVMEDTSIRAFKSVFTSAEGKLVLDAILDRTKFLKQCTNAQDMALNNFAKDLLLTIYWEPEQKQANSQRIMDFIRHFIKRRRSRK